MSSLTFLGSPCHPRGPQTVTWIMANPQVLEIITTAASTFRADCSERGQSVSRHLEIHSSLHGSPRGSERHSFSKVPFLFRWLPTDASCSHESGSRPDRGRPTRVPVHMLYNRLHGNKLLGAAGFDGQSSEIPPEVHSHLTGPSPSMKALMSLSRYLTLRPTR